MSSKDTSKKTMDVAKPGESAPDTSARPVLVTHRPIVQDPMVKDEKIPEHQADAKLDTLAQSEKVIQSVSVENTEPQTEKPVEPVAEAPAEPEKPDKESSSPDKAEQAALQKLVDEKKYFVPIGQASKRRNRRTLIVFLVILLLLAGTYVAIDGA